jgi:SAM-dependent methyltransferase
MALEWTGERFLPWEPADGPRIHYEHLHRYDFASRVCLGKSVLDLACGEGYGPFMISQGARSVLAIDIDGKAIAHASSKYVRKNLSFIHGSILDIPISGNGVFDVITCFEGLEHVTEHDRLLSEVKRLLKIDGIFVVSTPNREVLTDQLGYINSFHVRELYLPQFRKFLRARFRNTLFLGQKVYSGSNIWDLDNSEGAHWEALAQRNGNEFRVEPAGTKSAWYVLGVASDSELDPNLIGMDSWLVDLSSSLEQDSIRRTIELGNEVKAKDEQIRKLNDHVQSQDALIAQLTHGTREMQGGIAPVLSKRYSDVLNTVAPGGSKRRGAYQLATAALRIVLTEGWLSFLGRSKSWLGHRCLSCWPFRNCGKAISSPVTNQGESTEDTDPVKYLRPIGRKRDLPLRNKPGQVVTVGIALVRNEGDIISAWASHMLSLFDVILVADHLSTDGTREFLLDMSRSRPNVRIFSFDHPGYFQAEIMNRLTKIAAQQYPNSWIFPLDADEFVSIGSREELVSRIKKCDTRSVLTMRWQNRVPMSLAHDRAVEFTDIVLIPPFLSEYRKVAFHASAYIAEGWKLAQGNHALAHASGILTPPDREVAFADLIHYPIRSIPQFGLKCVQGCLAYDALPAARQKAGQGFHWSMMVSNVLKNRSASPEIARELAAYYGHPEQCTGKGLDIAALEERGWSRGTLQTAHLNEALENQRTRSFIQLAQKALSRSTNQDLIDFLSIVSETSVPLAAGPPAD